MIKALNSANSQTAAFVLVVLGLASFVFAAHVQVQDVRSGLMSSATGMIGAAIALLTKKDADPDSQVKTVETTISATDPKDAK